MDDIPKRLLFLVDAHGDGKLTVFAKKAGIPPSTFQYYLHGRMPHGEHLIRICECFKVNLNWLLTGTGATYIKEEKAQQEPDPQPSNIIELEHMELVRGFQDKPRAYKINQQLMELEQLDHETFKRIETYIKATVDQVKYAAEKAPSYGPDRRQQQRRSQEAPPPKGAERRSGRDRRKAMKSNSVSRDGILLI